MVNHTKKSEHSRTNNDERCYKIPANLVFLALSCWVLNQEVEISEENDRSHTQTSTELLQHPAIMTDISTISNLPSVTDKLLFIYSLNTTSDLFNRLMFKSVSTLRWSLMGTVETGPFTRRMLLTLHKHHYLHIKRNFQFLCYNSDPLHHQILIFIVTISATITRLLSVAL